MLRVRRRTMWKRVTALGLVIGLGAILVLGAGLATAKGKPPKPGEPTDTGTIYFYHADQMWEINPDGSGKTSLSGSLTHEAQPSKATHGRDRWFLQVGKIEDETYPDGNARYELFAVSEGGTAVQLTDDPTVQPTMPWGPSAEDTSFVEPRWATHKGVVDAKVSYNARRWDLDTGQVVEAGIYAALIDPDGLGAGFTPVQPSCLPVEVPLHNFDWVPEPYGHAPSRPYDWSPDGNGLVYNDDGPDLCVADANTAGPGTWLCDGATPRWSAQLPDGGSKILFWAGGAIESINPDGSHRTTIVRDPGGPGARHKYVSDPQWSPSGSHLIYEYGVVNVQRWEFVSACVYRATADGGDRTNLTNDLDHAYPVGWCGE